MVGILVSFWVSAYFQVRTVSFREIKSSVCYLHVIGKLAITCYFVVLSAMWKKPSTFGNLELTKINLDWVKVIFFTFYHGKSPLNHQLGEYVLLFPGIFKQNQVKVSWTKKMWNCWWIKFMMSSKLNIFTHSFKVWIGSWEVWMSRLQFLKGYKTTDCIYVLYIYIYATLHHYIMSDSYIRKYI